MNGNYIVSFCGDTVTRDVSRASIRAYLERKGFRKIDHHDDGESFALCEEGTTWESHRGLFVDVDHVLVGWHDAKLTIKEIARCLDRDECDVLREIAGEAVTLADAWDALNVALRAVGIVDATASAPTDNAAENALRYALEWRNGIRAIPFLQSGTDADQRVVHAAEDLAAIALADLRRARVAQPVEPST